MGSKTLEKIEVRQCLCKNLKTVTSAWLNKAGGYVQGSQAQTLLLLPISSPGLVCRWQEPLHAGSWEKDTSLETHPEKDASKKAK